VASEIQRAARDGVDEGLRDAAEFVKEAAQRNMPVGDPSEDPNPAVALEESIFIVEEPGSGTIEIQVRTPYAAKQELDRRLSHPRGGSDRYLEDALVEVLPRFSQIIASRVRARMAAQAKRSRKDRR
jgi:hypothetical protein